MDREDICRRVTEIAEQFGCGNPQENKKLSKQLAKNQSAEVLAGLLLVFSRSIPTASNYQKQELAGRMLGKVKPKPTVDLAGALRAVLPAYDPSIEQVPQYFSTCYGKEAVIQELVRFETEEHDPRSKAGAKTMRWWLGDKAAT